MDIIKNSIRLECHRRPRKNIVASISPRPGDYPNVASRLPELLYPGRFRISGSRHNICRPTEVCEGAGRLSVPRAQGPRQTLSGIRAGCCVRTVTGCSQVSSWKRDVDPELTRASNSGFSHGLPGKPVAIIAPSGAVVNHPLLQSYSFNRG